MQKFTQKNVVRIVAMAFAVCPAAASAQAPKDGVYITDEDVKAVLKYAVDTKRTTPDNTIRVIDMGSYQLGVAVIHRGAMGGRGNAAAAGGNAAAAPNPQPACGEQRAGATGPNGLFHDDTAETYVVISGGATLITGGSLLNGRGSPADSENTTILKGPSRGGTMVGYTSRPIKNGYIIVILEH